MKTPLMAAILLTSLPSRAAVLDYESSRLNNFFSALLNGSYASQAARDLLNTIPLIHLLPLEALSLEKEATELAVRESERAARRMIRQKIGEFGLPPALSLATPKQSVHKQQGSSKERTRIRARVSSSRIGLALTFRF